jgi:hypothetical protein
MEKTDFNPDDLVIYVPNHVNGNINHVECEYGFVSSISETDKWVFVKYINSGLINGTAAATDPRNLVKVKHV